MAAARTNGAASRFIDPEQTMRAHPFLVVLTCVLALALGSCNTGKGVSNGSTHGTLRVVNVIRTPAAR
jgi:hypothetical protein